MERTLLELFLPPFTLVFLGIVLVWSPLTRRRKIRMVISDADIIKRFRIFKACFIALLLLSAAIVLSYCYFPSYYALALPIDFLDTPTVNIAGVLILKMSLIWIITAQLNIDKTIFLINAGIKEWSHSRLIRYSEKLLLTGMQVMFVGLFVTLSNVVTILICIVGFVIFFRLPEGRQLA